jgi:hypothetical protein
MTYKKPQVAMVGRAMCAIQGSKPLGYYADMNPTRHQNLAANEADE